MKEIVCRICTVKLVESAYAHAWWFCLVREPLRWGMLALGRIYGLDTSVYDARSSSCRRCPRLTKLELKEKSALFRLLNGFLNPHFDRLIARLLTERERREAEEFAEKALRGEVKERTDEKSF